MNKKYILAGLIFGVFLIVILSGCISEEKKAGSETQKTVMAFCGSASKPPLEEAANIFLEKTNIKVELTFGGSGTVLSQMKMSKQGDLFIPGSPDYMVVAERDGVVYAETEKIIAYLIPAINVRKGNPKNIQSLDDMAKKGITVGICAPESCCVGLYAVEIFEYNNMSEKIKPNIIVHAESCSKTESLIVPDKVDAVMGWDVFSKWNPNDTDTVYLKHEQIPRIAYIPAAVSTYTKDRESSQKFIDFLASAEGQKIFEKWGYIVSEGEARKYAPNARIGGEYELPGSWKA